MIFNVTGGGGTALNFKVVGYATKEELLAATPAENTIGIITEIPITGYHFGREEPSPAAAGMVWITTGTSSPVEFNALKKNAIQVYPLSAKQQDGSAWVDVTAMSYQGGEWTEWRTYLYNSGDECTEITGGWANKRPSGYFSSNGSVVKNAQTMQITATKGQYIVAVTTNKINLADLNTLTFNVNSRQNGNTEYIFLCVFDDTLKDINAIAKINEDSVQIGTNIIDITSLNGAYYIGFGCASESGTASIEVSEVYMT